VHTFAPGLAGFDALYGFVADSLGGPYEPLNGDGLVATNPANAPFQTYSWMAFPGDGEVLVQSFLNYYDFAGESLDAVAEFPEDEQRRRFGGTLAPTLRLGVDGARTWIRGTLDHWRIPTGDEPLPPLAPDEPGAGGRTTVGVDEPAGLTGDGATDTAVSDGGGYGYGDAYDDADAE
jgi:levansucrase